MTHSNNMSSITHQYRMMNSSNMLAALRCVFSCTRGVGVLSMRSDKGTLMRQTDNASSSAPCCLTRLLRLLAGM